MPVPLVCAIYCHRSLVIHRLLHACSRTLPHRLVHATHLRTNAQHDIRLDIQVERHKLICPVTCVQFLPDGRWYSCLECTDSALTRGTEPLLRFDKPRVVLEPQCLGMMTVLIPCEGTLDVRPRMLLAHDGERARLIPMQGLCKPVVAEVTTYTWDCSKRDDHLSQHVFPLVQLAHRGMIPKFALPWIPAQARAQPKQPRALSRAHDNAPFRPDSEETKACLIKKILRALSTAVAATQEWTAGTARADPLAWTSCLQDTASPAITFRALYAASVMQQGVHTAVTALHAFHQRVLLIGWAKESGGVRSAAELRAWLRALKCTRDVMIQLYGSNDRAHRNHLCAVKHAAILLLCDANTAPIVLPARFWIDSAPGILTAFESLRDGTCRAEALVQAYGTCCTELQHCRNAISAVAVPNLLAQTVISAFTRLTELLQF